MKCFNRILIFDFGTSKTRVCENGKIVFDEPTEISYFSTDGNIKDAMVSYWDAYSFTAYWHPKWFLEPFFQNEVNKGIISQNPGY